MLNRDGVRRSAYDLLSLPQVTPERLTGIWPELGGIDAKTAELLHTEAAYAVYLKRQAADIAQLQREEARGIPENIDFSSLPGLSLELRQKMLRRRPRSLAEAERMEGMTPAALALIAAHLRRHEAAARGAT